MASDFVRDGGESTLSMEALVELLSAVTEKGKPFRFRASGFSMHPFIRNRDTIIISPLPSGRPETGDIVAFLLPGTGMLVVHRVIDRKNGCYIISGDNVPEPDGLIPLKNVIGLVTDVERNGRKVMLGLGTERKLIAFLARNDLLKWIRLFSLPKTLCDLVLLEVQGRSVYRRIARRLGPDFSIFEADGRDMAEVQAIWSPGSRVTSCKLDPLVTNYVSKIESKIVGFIQLVRHPEEHYPYVGHWIFGLTVRLKYRGLGIGESLCQRVIDRAEDDGAKELFLLVYDDNHVAINLYRKFGFELIKLQALESQFDEKFRASGRRRVVMHRDLQLNDSDMSKID